MQDRDHSIDVVLMITIMATMRGYKGYKAIRDFAQRYKDELIEYLEVEKNRLPAFATIRRVLMEIDHKEFSKIFDKREKKWVSVDRRAIKGTNQKEVLTARKTATKK